MKTSILLAGCIALLSACGGVQESTLESSTDALIGGGPTECRSNYYCGGIAGFMCPDAMTCRMTNTYPDAMGCCVGNRSASRSNGCHLFCPPKTPGRSPIRTCYEQGNCGEHDTGGRPVETCGSSMCGAGLICCNVSCGICTVPDGVCTMQFCGDYEAPVLQ